MKVWNVSAAIEMKSHSFVVAFWCCLTERCKMLILLMKLNLCLFFQSAWMSTPDTSELPYRLHFLPALLLELNSGLCFKRLYTEVPSGFCDFIRAFVVAGRRDEKTVWRFPQTQIRRTALDKKRERLAVLSGVFEVWVILNVNEHEINEWTRTDLLSHVCFVILISHSV